MLLGLLVQKLADLGLGGATDLVVVSDHGHSSVAGPASLFPLRAIASGAPAAVDANGYSASGDVRLADLLTRAGFTAFDGNGCVYSPVLSGIKADGSTVYPTSTDPDGSVCGAKGKKYTTPAYKVPMSLPAKAIVIAANGGSDYLYLPDHDAGTVQAAVRFLQSREELGAIFVATRYGALPGTLPLDRIRVDNMAGRNPDVVVSYNFDENAMVQGLPGIEFESMQVNRGMHGSFSPRDVHNTLAAAGVDFRAGFADPLPSGNVDVAPTVAEILGLQLPQADGRPLDEALGGGAQVADYQVAPEVVTPGAAATGLTMRLPTNPDGNDVDGGKSSYSIELHTKKVTRGNRSWTYFDFARPVRQ